MKEKCPDCDTEIDIPSDAEIGEVITCSCCGLEFEVKAISANMVDLQELTVEGEDWGE